MMKLTTLTAALALTAAPAMAQDKMTLLLDWFVNPDHGPIIIAEELGYFADQGLEVEVIAPADPSDPPKLVAAGQAELAISYQPQLHLQIHEGLPLQRVGTLVATPLNCLLALEDGPIQTPADLKGKKVAASVNAIVVPGSTFTRLQAEAEGIDRVFIEAGFDWRPESGCSMCLAMNEDKLTVGERCASTSNRNFEGRQGKGGRTHLVSPAMAAAAAIAGHLADVRDYQD